MTTADPEIRVAVYGVLGGGKTAHLLRYTSVDRDNPDAVEHGHAICGAAGAMKQRLEADERAEIVQTVPVCATCRGRWLHHDDGRAIIVVHPTRSRPGRPKGAPTMAASTTRKKKTTTASKPAKKKTTTARKPTPRTTTKAPSEPLLEPSTYERRSVERLQQERATINNRLSGLGTQVQRHLAKNDTEKVRAAEDRIAELQGRRQQLREIIDAKTGKTPATTAPASSRRAATRRGPRK